MGDGAPISQEIKLPTDVAGLNAATAKLDQLIARVDKLDHANAHGHESAKKHHAESEGAFKSLWDAMGKVIKREAELAVGIHAMGAAGLEAKGRVGEFLEFIGAEAALEVLKEIGEKVIDIGKEAIVSAANAERMNFALDAASGGKEAGENVRKWVEANAKFSEFTEQQNESAYLGLRRLGVGNDKAGLYMKAAEDIAAVSAPDQRSGVYQQTLDALARVHSQGRIQARSAMQLGIGVDDLKTLPGFSGLSNQKVWEKAEKANLDENTLMALIMRHTGEKAIGEKAADASQLLLTKFTKLSELPELFWKRLGETDTPKKLAAEIGNILDKLDPNSPDGRRIMGGLESAFESVSTLIGEIDFGELAHGVGVLASQIDPAIKLFKELAHDAKAAYDAIAPVANFFTEHGPIAWVGHALADRMAKRDGLGKAPITERMYGFDSEAARAKIHAMGGAHAAVEGPVYQPSDLSSLNAAMMGAGTAAGSGYAAGIADSTAKVKDAAAGLGESSHSSLMESIDAHSPSRKFAKAGGFAAEGYALGIEGGADRIGDAMDSTFTIPTSRYSGSSVSAGPRGPQVTIGDITIHVQGGSTNAETAGAVRDELLRSLRPALLDVFDNQDVEG